MLIWNCFKYIINWEIEGILHAWQHMRSKLFVTFYTSKIKFKLVIAPLVARVLKCLWVHIILSLIICRQASIIHYWAFDFLPGFNKSLQKTAVNFALYFFPINWRCGCWIAYFSTQRHTLNQYYGDVGCSSNRQITEDSFCRSLSTH